MSLGELRGKTAVITGASRGLGAGLAEDFHARGIRLGLCSRGEPALPAGDAVLAERVDVRDAEALERFTRDVAARFGGIDLWINNAGVLDPIGPVRDLAVDAFREHLDTNLVGVFAGSRSFVRHRRSCGGGGVLINISSGAAWSAYAGWSAYCAAKAGVERFTECVQEEEAESGLRAFSVSPGVIDTAMQEAIRDCDADRFPAVARFHDLKRDDAFNTPGFVAAHLLRIAFDPGSIASYEGASAEGPSVALRLPNEKS